MSSFDERAREWDQNKMHLDRSLAIASALEQRIPLKSMKKALEYGAGTGILSFLLRDQIPEIVLMDNSLEMVAVCQEKAAALNASNVHPLLFDLEHSDYRDKFDLIMNQMVLHHVQNVDLLLNKFSSMLNPGGYLAIADLYAEDGSFHGQDQDVHKGFEPEELLEKLYQLGFKNGAYHACFEINRAERIYPVFLLTIQK